SCAASSCHALSVTHSPLAPLYLLFSPSSLPPRALHSFPTRRSSDLHDSGHRPAGRQRSGYFCGRQRPERFQVKIVFLRGGLLGRSEEHTSELQSRFDLVCRLLLEKKKKESSIISRRRAQDRRPPHDS